MLNTVSSSLSLCNHLIFYIMKFKLLFASCLISSMGFSQLYTPSGVITGSSGSNNVGIGVSSPDAKLDIITNSSTGGLELRTTNSEGLGGVYYPSPFAFSVKFRDNSTPFPITSEVFSVAAEGQLTIGNPNSFTTSSYLRILKNYEVAYNNQQYMQFAYKSNGANHRIPTYAFDEAGSEVAIVDWGFGSDVSSAVTRLRLSENGSLYSGDINSGQGFASFAAPSASDASISGVNTGLYVRSAGTNAPNFAMELDNGAGVNLLTVTNTGIVNIGTSTPITDNSYSLYVAEGIRTEKIRVDIEGNWPDYVFDAEYEKMDFSELQCYILETGHLPYLPSAEDVESEGYDIASADQGILRNLEESTLRAIELDAELQATSEELEESKSKIQELEEKVQRLEELVNNISQQLQ